MNEDQVLTVKDPVVIAQQPEVNDSEVKQVAADVESLITTSNPHFIAPSGLENITKPVLAPNLSGVEGTGATEHPPAHRSVAGNLITLPDGFGTREDAIMAAKGDAKDGTADSGRVFERQDLRYKALRALKPAA